MSDSSRFVLKSAQDLAAMRKAGRLAAKTLAHTASHLRPGVTTLELAQVAHAFMKANGAVSATLGYKGFPGAICTSINDVVCHGIPKKEDVVKSGDLINLDVTVILDGWHGDCSETYGVGTLSEPADALMKAARKALDVGISAVRPGGWMGDVGEAIEGYLKPRGYGIVRALGGHGIGRAFHEGLFVSHHRSGKGIRLRPGMTFTIEPMVNEGGFEVYVDDRDGWTVFTRDGGLSAQFEHTVAVTEDGVEILTVLEE